MNLSAASQFKSTTFHVRPSVKRSIARLPPSFAGNLKNAPNTYVDRTFFHAIGIVMVVATLTAGLAMVALI